MNITFLASGIRIGRDASDKKIYKESTVTYRLIQELNRVDGIGVWKRFYPNRHGLTDCRQGVRNSKTGVIYWHERYQIESASEAFNKGDVYYLKA